MGLARSFSVSKITSYDIDTKTGQCWEHRAYYSLQMGETLRGKKPYSYGATHVPVTRAILRKLDPKKLAKMKKNEVNPQCWPLPQIIL